MLATEFVRKGSELERGDFQNEGVPNEVPCMPDGVDFAPVQCEGAAGSTCDAALVTAAASLDDISNLVVVAPTSGSRRKRGCKAGKKAKLRASVACTNS